MAADGAQAQAQAPSNADSRRARLAREALDDAERAFFERCREHPDGPGLYQRDAERLERMALVIHHAAAQIAALHRTLDIARDHSRPDGRTVTLTLTAEDLNQRFADSIDLGAEAQALLGAQLHALQMRAPAPRLFLANFGYGPGVDPEAGVNTARP